MSRLSPGGVSPALSHRSLSSALTFPRSPPWEHGSGCVTPACISFSQWQSPLEFPKRAYCHRPAKRGAHPVPTDGLLAEAQQGQGRVQGHQPEGRLKPGLLAAKPRPTLLAPHAPSPGGLKTLGGADGAYGIVPERGWGEGRLVAHTGSLPISHCAKATVLQRPGLGPRLARETWGFCQNLRICSIFISISSIRNA